MFSDFAVEINISLERCDKCQLKDDELVEELVRCDTEQKGAEKGDSLTSLVTWQ